MRRYYDRSDSFLSAVSPVPAGLYRGEQTCVFHVEDHDDIAGKREGSFSRSVQSVLSY